MGKIYDALARQVQETIPVGETVELSPDAAQVFRTDVSRQLTDLMDLHICTLTSLNHHEAGGAESSPAITTSASLLPERRAPLLLTQEITLDAEQMDPHLVALLDGDPHACEPYDKLAIRLIASAASRPAKRLLLASAHHGEGRTCVTLNLAGALARAGLSVLVIDSDLQRPSMLRLLGAAAATGLSDAVRAGMPLAESAVQVQPCGFSLLPARERVEHSAELLASPGFSELLRTCDPHFDFILFDSPPLLVFADVGLLRQVTDLTVLVIRPGRTRTAELARAIASFSREDIAGVVLNRASHRMVEAAI